MKKNTERIPEPILDDIRQNLGVEPGDTSKDEKINRMTPDDLFERWVTWHGMIGWAGQIRSAIREIYGVKLENKVTEMMQK